MTKSAIRQHYGTGYPWKFTYLVYQEGKDPTYMVRSDHERGFLLTRSDTLAFSEDYNTYIPLTPFTEIGVYPTQGEAVQVALDALGGAL